MGKKKQYGVCPKCGRILPEGYKKKYCEHCVNQNVGIARNIGKALGVVGLAATGVVLFASKGKINLKKL